MDEKITEGESKQAAKHLASSDLTPSVETAANASEASEATPSAPKDETSTKDNTGDDVTGSDDSEATTEPSATTSHNETTADTEAKDDAASSNEEEASASPTNGPKPTSALDAYILNKLRAESGPTVTPPNPRRAKIAIMAANLPSPDDKKQALDKIDSPVSPVVTDPVAAPSEVTFGASDPNSMLESSIDVLRSEAPSMPYMNTVEQVAESSRTGRGKVAIALVAVLVVVLVGVYAIVANHFTTHFFPNTTVNGDDVSGMSVDELSAYVTNIGKSYKTHVEGQGINLTIEGAQIDYNYDGATYGREAASQINAWSWPLELGRPHAYTVEKGISYDEGKLAEIVSSTVDTFNATAKQPTNAAMTYDESAEKFVITPDTVGTFLKKDEIVSIVLDAVATMQDEVSLHDDLLVQPTLTKDNEQLVATTKRANKLLGFSIVLRAAGHDVFTVDKNLILGWIGIADDLSLTINHDAIVQWAQGPLSVQVDTKGMKRAYTRPDGKQVTVEGSSYDYDYGWCLNGAALGDTLTDNLYNGVKDPIDMPMKQTAATWNPGGQEWGNRYIDVDLTEQHVRMYDDASKVIWESDCVSGNPIYGGGTQTGVYFIYDKESPMELVGLDYDHDGQADYRTWVTYWMPFDGGEGLHDMATRSAFGGNIYQSNGSHGCVNLPYSAAEQLYGITNVGDVVIVHW
jgi:hypothetical protein